MLTAYLPYDNFTGLDVAGSHDVLSSVPGPEPPLDAGSPTKAPMPIVDLVSTVFNARESEVLEGAA